MACDAAKEGKAVWNLGVLSFSPVIYHRKIRAAAEKLGIKPAEIYIFLDISDITDEAIIYRESEDGTITMAPSFHWFDTGQFLRQERRRAMIVERRRAVSATVDSRPY